MILGTKSEGEKFCLNLNGASLDFYLLKDTEIASMSRKIHIYCVKLRTSFILELAYRSL